MESKDMIVVTGSANADFFIEVGRLPLRGETISSKSTEIKSGGKVRGGVKVGSKPSGDMRFARSKHALCGSTGM